MTVTSKHAGAALCAAALFAGTAALAQEEPSRAIARLETADGNSAGSVEFIDSPHGVVIEVMVENMTPGEHAFHIHQTGACSPDFSASGSHFAPEGNSHGFFSDNGPHAGDLPLLLVGVDGTATAHMFNTRVTLGEGSNSLLDDDGSAVIVHSGGDTYGEEAEFGQPVACGVIEKRF